MTTKELIQMTRKQLSFFYRKLAIVLKKVLGEKVLLSFFFINYLEFFIIFENKLYHIGINLLILLLERYPSKRYFRRCTLEKKSI